MLFLLFTFFLFNCCQATGEDLAPTVRAPSRKPSHNHPEFIADFMQEHGFFEDKENESKQEPVTAADNTSLQLQEGSLVRKLWATATRREKKDEDITEGLSRGAEKLCSGDKATESLLRPDPPSLPSVVTPRSEQKMHGPCMMAAGVCCLLGVCGLIYKKLKPKPGQSDVSES